MSAGSIAEDIDVFVDEPTLDRWVYPFNANPGFRTSTPVFGALTSMGFDPAFDNRDGQMLIGFDTAGVVPVGLGPESYHIARLTVSVTVSSDQTFGYDPTPDPVGSWLPPGDPDLVPDRDPGRPVEVFGAGFRYGWTALTFAEDGPFCDSCSCFPPNPCVSVRSVFPIDLTGACLERDVSNNVLELFDPIPFAVGTNDGLTAGQLVPLDTVLTFEVDVTDPCIRGYLAQSLDQGMLDLVVASIFPAEQQQSGTFPELYTKENLLVMLDIVDAAQLHLVVSTGPLGDLDGDGFVGITDFLILLAAWGPCDAPCPPICTGDLDADCQVGITDFLLLLANWS